MPPPTAIPIDLWLWPLDPGAEAARALAAHLTAEEEARARRFLRAGPADAYRVARGGLRAALAGYAGGRPEALRFAYGPRGKPSLPGGPAFNLSHAGGWAALAVAADRPALPLGVDIERHRPVAAGLPERFFAPGEREALARLEGAAWTDAFFRCWTRKEAVIKATGHGLAMPLASFEVTLGAGEAARLVRLEQGRAEDWTLHAVALAPDLPGAVAAETGGAALAVTERRLAGMAAPG